MYAIRHAPKPKATKPTKVKAPKAVQPTYRTRLRSLTNWFRGYSTSTKESAPKESTSFESQTYATSQPTSSSWYNWFTNLFSPTTPEIPEPMNIKTATIEQPVLQPTERPTAEAKQEPTPEPEQPSARDQVIQKQIIALWELEKHVTEPYASAYPPDIIKKIKSMKSVINSTKNGKTLLCVIFTDFFSLPDGKFEQKFSKFNMRYRFHANDIIDYIETIIQKGGKLSTNPVENENFLATILSSMKTLEYYFSQNLIDAKDSANKDTQKPLSTALNPFYEILEEYANNNKLSFAELKKKAEQKATDDWNNNLYPQLLMDFKNFYEKDLKKAHSTWDIKTIKAFAPVVNAEFSGKTVDLMRNNFPKNVCS